MKRIYYFILVALLGLVTACSDDYAASDYSIPAENTIAFRCQSAFGDDNQTIWTESNSLGFFCEQTSSSNVELGVAAISAGETQGLFYTKLPWAEGEHVFYLYAPYNKNNTTTLLSGTLSARSSQNGSSVAHIEKNSLVYAKVTSEETENAVSVTLNHVFGYLDLAVDTDKWQDWLLESITLTSKSEAILAGDYTFDMSAQKLTFTDNENKASSITLNISDVVLSAETFHGCVAVAAPLSAGAFDVTVALGKDGEQGMNLIGTVNLATEIVPQEITAMTLDIDGFEEQIIEDDSIDLSDPDKDGNQVTANCYIAGMAGQVYRFPATVMGNDAITPAVTDYYPDNNISAPGITPAALQPVSAKLLWQTEPNLILNVRLRNGQVYFTLNGEKGGKLQEGNAVIAVYDDGGRILWSWHIWVTAEDLDAKAQVYTLNDSYKDAGVTIMMDRNLGALKSGMWKENNDNLGLGLFYQWGRKDPFPSIDDADMGATGALPLQRLRKTYDAVGNEISVNNNDNNFDAAGWCYFTGKTITIEESIGYPMNFGYSSSTNNWLNELRDDLWGNPYSTDVKQTGSKSIYDPCPPGYRVPHRYFGTGFTADGKDASTKKPANWTGVYKVQADFQNAGGNIFPYGSGNAYYPAAGLMFVNGGKIVPYRIGKYSGTYFANMPGNTNGRSGLFYFDYANTRTLSNNNRYIGGSVRCMKEQ